MVIEKSKCACYYYYTIESVADICPVCYWQKDFYQEKYIDDNGGPNSTSLRESRENFKKYAVIDQVFEAYVRPPLQEEIIQA